MKTILVTWSNIADGASYSNCAIGILQSSTCTFCKDSRYAKISNSGTHVFCNEDIAWLEVTVDDWWLAVIMKIVQSIHDIDSDI